MRVRNPVVQCAVVSLFMSFVAACTGEVPSGKGGPGDEEVGVQTGAIQYGDQQSGDPTFAAIYTLRDSGYRVLCAGTVIQRIDGWTGVLTGRRCVTVDGTTYGAVAPLNRVQFACSASPGASPPSDAYTAAWIDTAPAVQDCAHDAAIVWVNQEVCSVARLGIYQGSATDLVGATLDFWAYGEGPAGVLRRAWGFPITSVSSGPPTDYGAFHFTNQGTSSQGTAWLADRDFGAAGILWPTSNVPVIGGLAGDTTVAQGSSICGAAAPGFAKFIQDAVYFYFVSSMANPSYNLDANGDPPVDGGWVYGRHTDSGARSRINYFPATSEIKFWNTNLCWQPDSGYVRIRTCDGSTSQQWTLSNYEIRNVSTGTCITDAGEWPSMGACNGAIGTKWFWHPQP